MPEARIRSFFAGKLAVAAIFALALGLLLGVFARNTHSPALLGFALVAKPFGLLWTNALRMVVLPLMISYLVLAINAVPTARTAGKLGGTLAAARLMGMRWRMATALGILMNTRGLMQLIVLSLGLDLGDVDALAHARAKVLDHARAES